MGKKLEIKVNVSYYFYYLYIQIGWRICGNSIYIGVLEKKFFIFVLVLFVNFILVKMFFGVLKEVGVIVYK